MITKNVPIVSWSTFRSGSESIILTGWPKRNVEDNPTEPELVITSVWDPISKLAPTLATSEYLITIPSSSINLSFTRNFTWSLIVGRVLIKLESNRLIWFVTLYSIVPVNVPEFADVSSNSNRYIALFTSWLFSSPNENRSKTIGWVSVSLDISPTVEELSEESKLITKNALPDSNSIKSISESSIWTSSCAFDISPAWIISTGVVSPNPKNNEMLVSLKSVMSSCFSNDRKSKFTQFVPSVLGASTSIKRDWRSFAEIPRFIEIFSNKSLETEVVSITNLSELVSGTDEGVGMPSSTRSASDVK